MVSQEGAKKSCLYLIADSKWQFVNAILWFISRSFQAMSGPMSGWVMFGKKWVSQATARQMKEQRSYFFGSMVDEFMDKEVTYGSETDGSEGSLKDESYQGDARAEIEERWLVSGSKTTSLFSMT